MVDGWIYCFYYICYVGMYSYYVAIWCILRLFSYMHDSHVVCWVISRCGLRLLRIWSSLSRYISRICSLIKYKVHISDYIPYFYTFFPFGMPHYLMRCIFVIYILSFFFGSSRAKETLQKFSVNPGVRKFSKFKFFFYNLFW